MAYPGYFVAIIFADAANDIWCQSDALTRSVFVIPSGLDSDFLTNRVSLLLLLLLLFLVVLALLVLLVVAFVGT